MAMSFYEDSWVEECYGHLGPLEALVCVFKHVRVPTGVFFTCRGGDSASGTVHHLLMFSFTEQCDMSFWQHSMSPSPLLPQHRVEALAGLTCTSSQCVSLLMSNGQ